MVGDLFLCCHQDDLGEEGTTETLLGLSMEIKGGGGGVAGGDGPGVECSIVAAGMLQDRCLFGHVE
jgi:hypothetical protein